MTTSPQPEPRRGRPPISVLEHWRREMVSRRVTITDVAKYFGVGPRRVHQWWRDTGLTEKWPYAGRGQAMVPGALSSTSGPSTPQVREFRRKRLRELLKEVPDASDPWLTNKLRSEGVPTSDHAVRQDRRVMCIPPLQERREAEIADIRKHYPSLGVADVWDILHADGWQISERQVATIFGSKALEAA